MTDPFRIRDHVADFEAISERYRQLSARTRARHAHRLDLRYGPAERERLDIFMPAGLTRPAPLHLFVHGGYWRANAKEDYAFVAEPVLAAGGIAVIVEYGLMPAARMAALVDAVRRALRFVRQQAPLWGGDPARISASGHSAGAHLVLFLMAAGEGEAALPDPGVERLLLISGIYDLAPIRGSFLQAEIGLTVDEVRRWSPLSARIAPGSSVALAVGSAETAPFREQMDAMRLRLVDGGARVVAGSIENRNHMDVVAELADPASALGQALAVLVTAR